MTDWYQINNIAQIDSPALLVYPEKVQSNINIALNIIGNKDRLRPHVKTNKTKEVCKMMLESGISKFKCATIAEAEMLALAGAPDILLAYQPVGPKIKRLMNLIGAYPASVFSCIIDNEEVASEVNNAYSSIVSASHKLNVYIDLNVGMNRTGILPENIKVLAEKISDMPNLHLAGVHAYDGHIHDKDFTVRKEQSNISYAIARKAMDEIQSLFSHKLQLIIGGTPSFSIHAERNDCECSPGTFVFWDWGYDRMIEELPFEYAALVLSRVISIIDNNHICIDLGYKSVAAESPLPRVHFLNAPSAKPVAHSEEHLVLEVEDSSNYSVAMPLFGVPVHICPTVALYEKAYIISENEWKQTWDVIARNRSINY